MTALDTKALLEGVTPGKWTCSNFSVCSPNRSVASVYPNPQRSVRESLAEAEANARLIASAPRLAREHARMKEALERIAQIHGSHLTGRNIALAALKGEGDE